MHIVRKDAQYSSAYPWTLTWPGAPTGVYRFRTFWEVTYFLNNPAYRKEQISLFAVIHAYSMKCR